jgi:hypothetical protein
MNCPGNQFATQAINVGEEHTAARERRLLTMHYHERSALASTTNGDHSSHLWHFCQLCQYIYRYYTCKII